MTVVLAGGEYPESSDSGTPIEGIEDAEVTGSIRRRLEDAGFGTIATVTLLMKDTLVRVAEPALVPAGVR